MIDELYSQLITHCHRLMRQPTSTPDMKWHSSCTTQQSIGRSVRSPAVV